jgi:methionyl-tRNA synthetase
LELQLNSQHKILLISAKPAPNGGLHLGHMAGPYLRQDLLRRHYSSRGASVAVMGGTDPVDSFIAYVAEQQGVDSQDVANRYYHQICDDFSIMQIQVDTFINPLSPQWRPSYQCSFTQVAEQASNNGQLNPKSKAFSYDANSEQGVSGAWLLGNCPDCDTAIAGYFCEACGAHFDPAQVMNPKHRDNDKTLTFKPQEDLFFTIEQPQRLFQALIDAGVQTQELAIIKRQLDQGRLDIRLTEDTPWGMDCSMKEGRKWFGHGLLYGYCRLLGDIYQQQFETDSHPFDKDSDITTVNLFGIDNTVSHMINIQGIGEEIPQYKGFDYFVVNRFYLLEGKKFSTSARHLIWVKDLFEKSQLDSDGVRFVLCATSPTYEQQDLTVSIFLYWYNGVFIDQICQPVAKQLTQLQGFTATVPDETSVQQFNQAFATMADNHQFADFDPLRVIEQIQHWLGLNNMATDNQGYWWLKALALLIYPITPAFGQNLWHDLGHSGEPKLQGFEQPGTVSQQTSKNNQQTISKEQLSLCLPASLMDN